MSNVAIIGAQWGDEGKGKVVDILARRFDYVVRFQGGHNAGHTVVIDGQKYALHILPSGVFNPDAVNVIANGVVVDPFQLVKEIRGFEEKGVKLTPKNLRVSDRAQVIMPYHGMIDRFRDGVSGPRKIGTTGRGIGPAYEWKAARRGVRFCDIRDREALAELIESEFEVLDRRYKDVAELEGWTAAKMLESMTEVLDILQPYVVDTVALLAEARAQEKSLLFEGAQATLLDLDFGTYPYVTSSNSCAAGITAGAGVPNSTVHNVIGICKAYATRVGEGPFPTELHDATGEELRKAGMEFGTTTGRPRRCGWLDLVALKYAHNINGYDTVAIMKLDVLDGQKELKVCTSYTINGEDTVNFPASARDLAKAQPNYQTLAGWDGSVADVRNYDDLPEAAKSYLAFIEDYVGCPVGLVSVGPDREQTIIRNAELF